MKSFLCENFTGEVPSFVKKIELNVKKSCAIVGHVSCKMQLAPEGVWEIMVFPSPQEVVGGSQDGKVVYPGFNINVGKFSKMFDKGLKVGLNCMDKNITEHLMFVGKIEGNDVKVAILIAPPIDQKPVEKIHMVGIKKGIIENN